MSGSRSDRSALTSTAARRTAMLGSGDQTATTAAEVAWEERPRDPQSRRRLSWAQPAQRLNRDECLRALEVPERGLLSRRPTAHHIEPVDGSDHVAFGWTLKQHEELSPRRLGERGPVMGPVLGCHVCGHEVCALSPPGLSGQPASAVRAA